MQNRYAGDIGDFIKFALLRHLSEGRRLGIAWYLYPDEGHNSDGKHVRYLSEPQRWRGLDPPLFDALKSVITDVRSVEALQSAGILSATYSSELLTFSASPHLMRSELRAIWFKRVMEELSHCDLVFADPDNGIIDDKIKRRTRRAFSKQMPLSEVRELAQGRCGIIYHHNTRFKGGHDAEVDYLCRLLGPNTLAVRASAFSCRTFFVLNPDDAMVQRTKMFCQKWSKHRVYLHSYCDH